MFDVCMKWRNRVRVDFHSKKHVYLSHYPDPHEARGIAPTIINQHHYSTLMLIVSIQPRVATASQPSLPAAGNMQRNITSFLEKNDRNVPRCAYKGETEGEEEDSEHL